MLIAPNSEIRFLDVPWDATYENTMWFETIDDQYAYMSTREYLRIPNNYYMRKGKGWIRVGRGADTLSTIPSQNMIGQVHRAAYMMFKNTSYENKWWYAFIDRVEYVNDNTVDVYYTIDVIQSYLFEAGFNSCFIERQHTETDIFGENTIPENFETGDYVNSDTYTYRYEPCIVVVTDSDREGNYAAGNMIPGLQDYFSGLKYQRFYPYEINELNEYLESFTRKPDAVVVVLMAPTFWMGAVYGEDAVPPETYTTSILYNGEYCLGNGTGVDEGYTPRNKKLLTYPYNMLYVSNYQGSHNELKFEYFSNPINVTVKFWGNCSTNPGLICWPVSYKGVSDNKDESIQLTGFPMCAWTYDTFKAWLAQNGGTLTAASLGIASQIAVDSVAKNFAPGGSDVPRLLGDVAPNNTDPIISKSGIMGALALAGQVRDHYVKPPTLKGSGNGNLLYQADMLTFMLCKKHIRKEYALIIDDFFDLYGYAIHRVGVPNRAARPCYTYVKTQGCSIYGTIPANDARAIEKIYDNGIRFWRTTALFGNYDPTINNNSPGVTA